jgi:hypothetical protein
MAFHHAHGVVGVLLVLGMFGVRMLLRSGVLGGRGRRGGRGGWPPF